MYLSKIVILNYRSCKCIDIDLLKDVPNIYIGVNDCGKTSILKAIGLLLDDKPHFNFVRENASKKDFSNSPLTEEEFEAKLHNIGKPGLSYNRNQAVIIGKFIPEAEDITEDNIEKYSNQLAWCLECNSDELWIAKVFDNNTNTSKCYLYLNDQLDSADEPCKFYSLSQTNLNAQRKAHQVDDDIKNENGVGRYSKLEIIRALYNKLGTDLMWTEYKYESEFFPKFRYLDWNMSLDEINKTATDIMSSIITNFVSPVKANALEQASAAELAINERLEDLKEIIAEIAPITGLKTKVQFSVQEKVTDVFVNKSRADGDIHMELQGDGLKRQIWFALVKASLSVIPDGSTSKRFIWAFDEPETHLYPSAQRKLFDIIKDVNKKNVQCLVSTHSTVFIDKSQLSAIKCVQQAEHCYSEYYTCVNVDDVFMSLEIRNSDFLFYDKFLVIEGQTEHHLIPALYKLYANTNLKDENIQLINLNGASKWTEQKHSLENVLNGFKKSLDDVVYLFDNDQKFKIGQGAINGNLFFVGNQDIEDAIANEVWIKIVEEATEGAVVLKDEEIAGIKEAIPAGYEVKSSKEKFLGRLETLTKQRLEAALDNPITYDILPRKGASLAENILKHITLDLIPAKIIECFQKLSPRELIVAEVMPVEGSA
ncbi:MAG: AAA family ATPase [Flavisolibacter sp.]|nr:AAA family ATPase [Flavisolibacter sp.]